MTLDCRGIAISSSKSLKNNMQQWHHLFVFWVNKINNVANACTTPHDYPHQKYTIQFNHFIA